MADKFQSTRRLYDQLGRKYLKSISKARMPELFNFIKLFSKGSKILDVGCAGGRDSRILVSKGLKVIGVDTSSVFLKEAKKLVPEAKFFKKDLRKLNFKNNSFDGIWANATLLHIDRRSLPRVLRSFQKILKKNGVIHVSVKKGRGTRFVAGGLTPGHKRLFSFYSATELKSLFKGAGLKTIFCKETSDPLDRRGDKWITIWGKKI